MTLKPIYTYECWSSDQPSLMGCLFADTRRGKESCSFEYDTSWLKTHIGQYFLDPDLGLYRGRQYAPNGKSLFGIFEDSCPDRWGRMLMQRREAMFLISRSSFTRTEILPITLVLASLAMLWSGDEVPGLFKTGAELFQIGLESSAGVSGIGLEQILIFRIFLH